MTECVDPLVAEAVARIRDQLATGTSCILLNGHGGATKSTIIKILLSEPDFPPSRRAAQHGIDELDTLHGHLDRGDGLLLVYDPMVYSGRPDALPALTVSIASPADAADHPWSCVSGSLPAGQLIPFELPDAERRTSSDMDESAMGVPEAHNVSSCLTFDERLSARLRQELLRLVNRMRMVLRLRLIYILSGLSRIPDAINFVLLLLAAARCYGRRTEPSAYTLPVLTSMSVVTGRLPARVS
jgi:hypothetical protein